MKVLAVERVAGCWPEEAASAIAAREVVSPACLPVTLLTDSAIVREGNPVFLPDFADGWMLCVAPYFSIGRLGKGISPKFTPRYVDGFGLVARLVPTDSNPAEYAVAGALGANFDGALLVGKRFPAREWAKDDRFMLAAGDDGQDTVLTYADLHLEDTVALVSRYMMLKTGDMIIPCGTSLQFRAEIGLRATVALNGLPALNIKVK